ncbi:MAG: glycosyltransferase family 2 protein [Chitinophagales bacterium]|nr:glycosyltransferase family 2 protein [Chitinophagales bacterium]MDW8427675.1 glycosyltransferase family 2 protein [Chitinophagales bacterium]
MELSVPSVAVVILCWRGKTHLQQFLPSVVQHTPHYAQIIVVDNASDDGTAEFIRKTYPQLTFLQLSHNHGYAGGYNEVIKQLSQDIIVLLNQDVEVTAHWLEPILKIFAEQPKVGAVQPRIRSYTQKEYFEYAGAAGGWIDCFGYTFCRGRLFDVLEKDQNQYAVPTEIFWASGACMAVRRHLYVSLGGLDPYFFAHMEEIDLCWRLKNQGHQVWYCPDSVVYHVGGSALPQGHPLKTYLNYRNNLLMLAKNLPLRQACWIIPARMALDGISAIRSVLRGYPRDVLAIVRAHGHFLYRWPTLKATGPRRNFFSHTAVYAGSLVWSFFILKKKYFSQLRPSCSTSNSTASS